MSTIARTRLANLGRLCSFCVRAAGSSCTTRSSREKLTGVGKWPLADRRLVNDEKAKPASGSSDCRAKETTCTGRHGHRQHPPEGHSSDRGSKLCATGPSAKSAEAGENDDRRSSDRWN